MQSYNSADYDMAARALALIANADEPRATPKEVWRYLAKARLEIKDAEGALAAVNNVLDRLGRTIDARAADQRPVADSTTTTALDGRFQLLHRIGSGGQSDVWSAIQTDLLREVAVKRSASGDEAAQMHAEARIIAGMGRTFQIPRPFLKMTLLENVMTAAQGQVGETIFSGIQLSRNITVVVGAMTVAVNVDALAQ